MNDITELFTISLSKRDIYIYSVFTFRFEAFTAF